MYVHCQQLMLLCSNMKDCSYLSIQPFCLSLPAVVLDPLCCKIHHSLVDITTYDSDVFVAATTVLHQASGNGACSASVIEDH